MELIRKLKKQLKLLYIEFRRAMDKDKSIYLIYSMGKVGSSTIFSSLQRKKPYGLVYHVHFLSKNYLENILPQTHENYHHNIQTGKEILDMLARNPDRKVKIITLTREPVSRTISDLFQNWDHIYDDIESVKDDELRDFIESSDFGYTLGWFDEEFKDYLGFDIYDHPFTPEKGYGIYSHNHMDILCIKLEKLNEVSSEALTEFLGFDLELSNTNESAGKKGYEKYRYLKKNVQLDEDKLDSLYSSRYMTHFYSVEEIKQFRSRWGKVVSA